MPRCGQIRGCGAAPRCTVRAATGCGGAWLAPRRMSGRAMARPIGARVRAGRNRHLDLAQLVASWVPVNGQVSLVGAGRRGRDRLGTVRPLSNSPNSRRPAGVTLTSQREHITDNKSPGPHRTSCRIGALGVGSRDVQPLPDTCGSKLPIPTQGDDATLGRRGRSRPASLHEYSAGAGHCLRFGTALDRPLMACVQAAVAARKRIGLRP